MKFERGNGHWHSRRYSICDDGLARLFEIPEHVYEIEISVHDLPSPNRVVVIAIGPSYATFEIGDGETVAMCLAKPVARALLGWMFRSSDFREVHIEVQYDE